MSPPIYIPSPQTFIQQPQQDTTFKEIFITNKPSQWNMGLCDCCDNMTICLQGLFIPCHLFGKNVERVEGDRYYRSCLCYAFCCGACNHSASRRKLRVKYNLPEEPFNDCCVSWCCGPCGLCQESLEITEQERKRPFRQEMRL
jgi:Cys-rich protein (TIGR01571 family)